jgi:hypothetical protein
MNFVDFISQENYTDWVAAAGWWILVSTISDREMSPGQRNRPLRPLISVL